ncbi:hypothetical protein GCM10010174_78280 [Kutzneria viridogrisea]
MRWRRSQSKSSPGAGQAGAPLVVLAVVVLLVGAALEVLVEVLVELAAWGEAAVEVPPQAATVSSSAVTGNQVPSRTSRVTAAGYLLTVVECLDAAGTVCEPVPTLV